MRFTTTATAFLAATAIAAGGASAAPAMTDNGFALTIGQPDGEHAEVAFSADTMSDRAIVISTHLMGVAGSRLSISIDRKATPLFKHILAEDECKFVDNASDCQIALSGNSDAYGRIVYAFKRGLVLHFAVETAGLTTMSQDASLRGFTAAYRQL